MSSRLRVSPFGLLAMPWQAAGFARLISEPALARVVYNSPGVEPRKGRNPGYGIKKKYEPRRGGIKGCIMS